MDACDDEFLYCSFNAKLHFNFNSITLAEISYNGNSSWY